MTSPTKRALSHEGNIATLKRKKCAQQFMMFAGLWRDYMSAAPDFLRNSGISDRNTMVLRDPYDTFYERGVSSDISSSELLTEWIYNYLRKAPHIREAYTVGNSAGAYAAIYFGCKLGVDEVFAFAPSGLNRLTILMDAIEQAPSHTKINVFYDTRHERDTYFATQLGQSDRVKLVPSPEDEPDGHWVMIRKLERNQLRDIFPPYRAVDSAPASGG
ncbi:hypothetical protein [Actibacterium atlanticum]|uniref:hypothetical protein n=1 Tax=Actibacterium atlanticum TaxID=1461693 RepID=UPI0005561E0B|nr:hypothetical protein [Actibacterium atlanticum]